MRITRLKLRNYIGIKHGLDREEVEIFFPDNHKLITMFNGRNGSGKSCIMAQLTPFKESFDDRKTLIIDGKEGLKEIDIEANGDKYEIVHYFKKIPQSFIKKNGVELNENGGVRTFNEIVEKELGITPDFFKIGKIGSNTESFIQFTASDRKKLISKFLPDINDYLEKFEIVKEKFREISSNIKIVSADLSKLQNEEEIKLKLSQEEKLKSDYETEIETLSGEIAVLKEKITSLSAEIEGKDLATMNLQLQAKLKAKNDFRDKAASYVRKYNRKDISTSELETLIEEKNSQLLEVEKKLASLSTERNNINFLLVENQNNLKKKQLKLREFSNIESSSKLEEEKAKKETEKKEVSDFIKSSPLNGIAFLESIRKFKDLFDFLQLHYSELNDKTLNQKDRNIDFFINDNPEEVLIRLMNLSRKDIEDSRHHLDEISNAYARKSSNLSKLEILQKRPSECSISTCPFIADALQYKNLPAELEDLNERMTAQKKSLEEKEAYAEVLTNLNLLYKEFNEYCNRLDTRSNPLFLYFVKNFGTISVALQMPLTEFVDTYRKVIEDSNAIIEAMNKDLQLEKDIENFSYRINLAKNVETSINEINEEIKNFEAEIEKLKNKFIETDNQNKALLEEKNSVSEELNDHKGILQGKKDYSELVNSIRTLEEEINIIRENSNRLEEIRKDLTEKEKKLNSIKFNKDEVNQRIIQLKSEEAKLIELKNKKKDLEENFETVKMVKDSLDPNKGIPLYFIKSYLEKTKDITNDLLSVAFNGNFEIDFVTSATEFFIRVRSGNNIKNDIKEASQGEIALTTISISFALIEQSIGKFNILSLDEMDGALDGNNRAHFIEILEKQAKKLGIEQIFVISHNNVFDLCSTNLVLLPGNTVDEDDTEYMRNKEIIFKA